MIIDLPCDWRTSTVLGARVTPHDQMYRALDFSRAWPDPGFPNGAGESLYAYLHVPIVDLPGDPADNRVYRVRCLLEPGDVFPVAGRWRLYGAGARLPRLTYRVLAVAPVIDNGGWRWRLTVEEAT